MCDVITIDVLEWARDLAAIRELVDADRDARAPTRRLLPRPARMPTVVPLPPRG